MEYWYGFIGHDLDWAEKAAVLQEWALAGWKFTGHAEPDGDSGLMYLMEREYRLES
jgi:hypothetical protein